MFGLHSEALAELLHWTFIRGVCRRCFAYDISVGADGILVFICGPASAQRLSVASTHVERYQMRTWTGGYNGMMEG